MTENEVKRLGLCNSIIQSVYNHADKFLSDFYTVIYMEKLIEAYDDKLTTADIRYIHNEVNKILR